MATFLLASAGASLHQLYDELLTALPVCAPTPTGPDGRREAQVVIAQVSATQIQIMVPDTVAESEVQGILKAHVPRPDPPDPWDLARTRMRMRASGGDPGGGLAGVCADVLILLGMNP